MSGLAYARIMSRIINTPLFVEPSVAAVVYNVLAGRIGTGRLEVEENAFAPRASRFDGERVKAEAGNWRQIEPFLATPEGTAIITVDGELVNRGAWIAQNDSGMTSYEGIQHQLKQAAKNSKIKNIILDMNSPGGEATGSGETSALVKAIAAEKPVYAVVNGMAASAGYSLVSGATNIISGASGLSGSIGCVMMHMDISEAAEKAGAKPTFIYSGDHKVDGNSFQPLSDDVKKRFQAECDKFYDMFLGTVASGRGRKLSKKAARDTQARTYIGQDAVDVGLVDAIGTFDDVLGEATLKARKMGSKGSTTATRSLSMSLLDDGNNPNPAPAPVNQVAGPQSLMADGRTVEATIAAARADAMTVGAAGAYTRINAILASPACKGRESHAMRIASKHPAMAEADVIELVEQMPVAAAAPATAPLQERVAATGVQQVGAAPLATEQPGNEPDWDASGKAAVAALNKSRGVK